jgi:hypothetical protein
VGVSGVAEMVEIVEESERVVVPDLVPATTPVALATRPGRAHAAGIGRITHGR